MLVMGVPETEGLTQGELDYLNETVYDRCRCVRSHTLRQMKNTERK
jgi:hypothetical protein